MHRAPALMRARRLVCDASMVRLPVLSGSTSKVGCQNCRQKTKSTQIYPTNEGLKPSPSSRLPTYVPRSPRQKDNHLARRWHSFVARARLRRPVTSPPHRRPSPWPP